MCSHFGGSRCRFGTHYIPYSLAPSFILGCLQQGMQLFLYPFLISLPSVMAHVAFEGARWTAVSRANRNMLSTGYPRITRIGLLCSIDWSGIVCGEDRMNEMRERELTYLWVPVDSQDVLILDPAWGSGSGCIANQALNHSRT